MQGLSQDFLVSKYLRQKKIVFIVFLFVNKANFKDGPFHFTQRIGCILKNVKPSHDAILCEIVFVGYLLSSKYSC